MNTRILPAIPRLIRLAVAAALAAGILLLIPADVEARIISLKVIRLESPTFGGMSFGAAGPYEKITVRAVGEVDPSLPANALITDIRAAPRNARGMVEYSTDVVILKPVDPARGSGIIFYDVVNRGNKGSFTTFNQAAAPSHVADTGADGAGTGLLMRRGYTIVWSGWEDAAIIGSAPNRLSASLPIARNTDGSSIVEKIIAEQIFDNANAHAIAANDRFGDANATGRSYQRHLSAKMEFPFWYEMRTDPFTKVRDGILARCQTNGTCPKVMHTDGGNEPYLKPVSLLTTDGPGNGVMPKDVALPSNVRVYTIGSTQHGPAGSVAATPSGVCQQPANPNQWAPHVRALGIALDDWVTHSVEPPASRYAKVSDRTLVRSMPQASQGFPTSPGVTYTGWYNTVDVLDKRVLPNMAIPGKSYTILVPKADADGNDIPGIRTVDVQVPIATYTGWGLRRAPFAANEDCALTGQYIPFAATKAERLAKGDPRLSVQERYPDHQTYVDRVTRAVNDLVGERLLLKEDAQPAIDKAQQSAIGR